MKNTEPIELTSLSEKDKEILNHRRGGLTIKEVASKVYLSQRAVEDRLLNLRRRSNSKNDIELLDYCYRNNLLIENESLDTLQNN